MLKSKSAVFIISGLALFQWRCAPGDLPAAANYTDFINQFTVESLSEARNATLRDVISADLLLKAGVKQVEAPPKDINPHLQIYLDQFLQLASINGRPISESDVARLRVLQYADDLGKSDSKDQKGAVSGLCKRLNFEEKSLIPGGKSTLHRWLVVHLSKEKFEPKSENARKWIVFHELFHCFFDKGHLASDFKRIKGDDIPDMPAHLPAGIMSASIKEKFDLDDQSLNKAVELMFSSHQFDNCADITH